MTEVERLLENGFITMEFLEPEVRCDYKISTEMKKVWAIEMDLFREVSRVCEEHHLRYWITYGTLLGAVRHKGYIPWDDDFDIMMPRADYQKLIRLQKEFKAPYFFQTTQNDVDYYSSFARLRNSNTTGILVSPNNRCNNGIYIDIYPLDGAPKTPLKRKWVLFLNQTRNVLAHAYVFNINPSKLTRLAHKILHLPFVPYDPVKTYKKVNGTAAKVKWKDADRVGLIAFPFKYGEEYLSDKKNFRKTVWLDYEFMKMPAPAGYDQFLRDNYGEYMEFPPVEDRGAWHDFVFEPDVPYKEYKGPRTNHEA